MGYGTTDGLRQKFTSKERDNETGLDYFGVRYYGSTHGRFTSVDPMLMDENRMFEPQRINAYAYARNNPLKFIDPDGADPKEPKVITVHKPYSVHGKTADEAFRDAGKQAPNQSRQGGIGEAQVDYTWEVKTTHHTASRGKKGAGFEIDVSTKVVDVTVTVTLITPQWAEYNQASPEEQEKWDESAKPLEDHENDHKAIGIEGGQQIQNTLDNTKVTGQGRTPQQALNNGLKKLKTETDRKAGQINAEVQKKQDQLDKDTEHGTKKTKP